MIKRLARVFVSALARRIAFVLVALLVAWLGLGKAHAAAPAANPGGCDHYMETTNATMACSDQGFAMSGIAQVTADTSKMQAACQRNAYPTFVSASAPSIVPTNTYRVTVTCKTSANNPVTFFLHSTWVANCTVRNQYLGALVDKNALSDTQCTAGCEFKIVADHQLKNVTVTSPGQSAVSAGTMHVGKWEYSGNACGQLPAKPRTEEKPKTECLPAANGQTFCMTAEGKECYTASTGRTICWGQTERGEKPDGPTLQKNQNGQTPTPPDTPPPPGDNFVQGTSTNVTTTKPDTSTTTNVVTNHTTGTGGPAGGTNTGTGTDGSGAPTGGTTGGGGGSSGDDDGTASGGGDCETPPITTGDPIMGMVATQTWATRCAVEASNAANASGDIANCNDTFTVEGNTANALKLRAMRKEICPGEVGMPSINPGDYLGDGTGEPTAAEVTTSIGDEGFDGWDESGFGFSRSCPPFPTVTVFGNTINLGGDGRNEAACDIAMFLGWLVIFFASISCIRIVTEA